MSSAVFVRDGLTGKVDGCSRLQLPNRIIGCRQEKTAFLTLKKIGLHLELIVTHIISVSMCKRTDDEAGFPQGDGGGAWTNKQFARARARCPRHRIGPLSVNNTCDAEHLKNENRDRQSRDQGVPAHHQLAFLVRLIWKREVPSVGDKGTVVHAVCWPLLQRLSVPI